MTHDFVHLHLHTEYSLLDGAIRTKNLAQKVAQWNIKAAAITDHGVLYGAMEFYKNCIAHGVKPILGCETYIAPNGIDNRIDKRANHLILLAENQTGWHNLIKLISIANTRGFWYKPRIEHKLLQLYHDGIIASSACLAGEIPQLILSGNIDEALKLAVMYDGLFGRGNFFLEIMPNSLPQQKTVNEALISISRKTDIPLIATCDAHYLNPQDYDWHKILLRINTHADPEKDDAFGFDRNEFYLMTPDEMHDHFAHIAPDALSNTVQIAERCNVKLIPDKRKYLLPETDGDNPDDELRRLSREGLRSRFQLRGSQIPDEYNDRLERELSVITQMGFSSYFLIVSGIIQAAKSRNIPIGPGRGSAAGSVVAWSLNITELDPLRYNLLFERFLNPERISMPDIDTDVSDKGREELLRYISDKYGAEHVAQIITFGRMKGRQSVKDVGRALGMDYSLMDKTAKLIPAMCKSLSQAIDDTPELKAAYDSDITKRNIIDKAKNIEGLARHTSQHAAGVVITPMPVTDIVPVKRLGGGETSQVVTQFTMGEVEELGLVKMDFLGLSTLSIIQEALDNIKRNGKPLPDMAAVNEAVDDADTFRMISAGDTMGVFQLESDGMRSMLRKLKPDCFDDLIAALAMYRPGPLDSGMVDQYIDCKHGRTRPHYPHKMLEPVLRETYGVILYQEQVMQCASTLAGYTLGEADLLRRAMGKKKLEVMQEQRAKFLDGAKNNGINPDTASAIFDNIEKFAGYGFNKSHSAAYALISYDTAWLKFHYRAEFLSAYLSSQMKAKREVLGHYVHEVRRSGINVLPPDINTSAENFTPVGSVIRFGLGAVARMGHNAVDMIIARRNEGGNFSSLWDFIKRTDMAMINRAVIENLIKAGAFDEINPNRAMLLNALPKFIEAVQNINSVKNTHQLSLFDDEDGAHDEALTDEPDMPIIPDFDAHTRLDYEKQVTGLYISGHPYEAYEAEFSPFTNCKISEIPYWKSDNVKPCIAGIITRIKEKSTKKGGIMCTLQIEDTEGSIEAVIFPKMWETLKGTIHQGEVCILEGRTDERGQFIPDRITAQNDDRPGRYITLTISADALRAVRMNQFVAALNSGRGNSRLILEITDEAETCRIILSCGADGDKLAGSLSRLLTQGNFSLHSA